jgi:hypothetical protein
MNIYENIEGFDTDRVVDNFYEYPAEIRQLSLMQEFYEMPGNYPGLRTIPLILIDRNLYFHFCQKLCSLFYDLEKQRVKWKISTSFQSIDERYETGWVHNDSLEDDEGYDKYIAGVIYLHPYPSQNSGTSIFENIVTLGVMQEMQPVATNNDKTILTWSILESI